MEEMISKDKIIILDFGSQYTKLIAKIVRESNVFSEICPCDTPLEKIFQEAPKGIILSGGPKSAKNFKLTCNEKLLSQNIPLLGICYGMQLMNVLNQGKMGKDNSREFGEQSICLEADSLLFSGLEKEQTVWMSHNDSVLELASCYKVIARNQRGQIAAIQHQVLPHFGVQFHPELTHTEKGKAIINNFLSICQCERNWSVDKYIAGTCEKISEKVQSGCVISLVSGGVDSTVATLISLKALGNKRVYPLHIESGLQRQGESDEVKAALLHQIPELKIIDAKKAFLSALKGVIDPERKRKIIGDLFIACLENAIKKIESEASQVFICQGTLYTDLIESGQGLGKYADVIKTHHNVGSPIVRKKREKGLLIEPNAGLFKDEVRKVALVLGVPKALRWRHPFPGPGLAIRILGEVTLDRLQVLREADSIFIEEIKIAGLYDEIWQAFAVLLPAKAVGVMGDQRTLGQVIVLRAVNSIDGMTARVYPFSSKFLAKVATRIVNEVNGVNRVVYDITSKPPGTIEWE